MGGDGERFVEHSFQVHVRSLQWTEEKMLIYGKANWIKARISMKLFTDCDPRQLPETCRQQSAVDGDR